MSHSGDEREPPGVLLVGGAQQGHGQDHQQDGLLMDVPAEEEGGPGTEGERPDELVGVVGAGPELDQGGQPGQDGEAGGGEGRDVGED